MFTRISNFITEVETKMKRFFFMMSEVHKEFKRGEQ